MIETLAGVALLAGVITFGMVRAYRSHLKANRATK